MDGTAADTPLVAARSSSVSFGRLEDGATSSSVVELRDLGGGSGDWVVRVERTDTADALVSAPPTATVPGLLTLTVAAGTTASDNEVAGVVLLERDGVTRRIPFWGLLATARLDTATAITLAGSATVSSDTRLGTAAVSRYRYPDLTPGGTVTARLNGPEVVFRLAIGARVANFGVVVTWRDRGVTVEPRIVGASEHHLAGHAALPIVGNPYLAQFDTRALAAGVLAPAPGTYHLVFDSPTVKGAGPFRFRVWVDDTTPPRLRLVARDVVRGRPLRIASLDGGSGVHAASIVARVDGKPVTARLRGQTVEIPTPALTVGRHRLHLRVSDWQETRNTENVGGILPNTTVLETTFTVRKRA